jgi:hypothetical protein
MLNMTTTTPTTHTLVPLAAAGLPATPRVVALAASDRAANEGKVPADVATASLRAVHRIARLPIAAPASLVRWTLRMVTVIVFGAATAFGVSLGMNAPEISPTSVVQHHVASSDQ